MYKNKIYDAKDTIFAQASARGKAGVAVFRISGPDACAALPRLSLSVIEPRKVYTQHLVDAATQTVIDQGVILYFAAPHSFTGEDVIELQVHGSIAVAKLLTNCLASITNFRPALPGEFARRAFLNHKMDLTSAEGLADLIEAETEMQHLHAMRQFSGELAKLYSEWREQIISISSDVEALIDFPTDEVPPQVLDEALYKIEQLKEALQRVLRQENGADKIREGLSLVIIGEPNVGKSSLGNHLAGRQAAIVSDLPGTTRDIVESYVNIGGYPIIIKDTAGIRQRTNDQIEQYGINLALSAAENADIKILLFDPHNVQQSTQFLPQLVDNRTVLAVNKCELLQRDIAEELLPISVRQCIGIDTLITKISEIAESVTKPLEPLTITRLRHRRQLEKALVYLENCHSTSELVLIAEDLRLVARHLSLLTGKIELDEVLDSIFSNFCIGK